MIIQIKSNKYICIKEFIREFQIRQASHTISLYSEIVKGFYRQHHVSQVFSGIMKKRVTEFSQRPSELPQGLSETVPVPHRFLSKAKRFSLPDSQAMKARL